MSDSIRLQTAPPRLSLFLPLSVSLFYLLAHKATQACKKQAFTVTHPPAYAHIHTHIYTLLSLCSHLSRKLLSEKWVESTTFPGTLAETGASIYQYSHFLRWECCENIQQMSLCCDLTPCVCLTTRQCLCWTNRKKRFSHCCVVG